MNKEEEYCLLYHINVGYPMLDDGVKVIADVESYTPRTAWAKQNEATMYATNDAVPNQEEACYFLKLSKPEIALVNEKIGKKFTVSYSGLGARAGAWFRLKRRYATKGNNEFGNCRKISYLSSFAPTGQK